MPTERLNDFLFDVDQQLQQAGLPALEGTTLREVYQRLGHPQVQQAIQGGQVTPEMVVREVQAALQARRQPATPGMRPPQPPMPMAGPQPGLMR